MTKISVYNIDEYVTADDKWIGTDVNTYNKTKNFTPRKLSHYFNNNQVINTGVDLLYKYFTITAPETRPTGTLSFETEIGPTVNFSAISTFLLSNTTLKGNYIVEFFDFLVGTNVLLYKAKNINLFGSYKILSVEEYLPEPNFFVVNVEFIEGNGFIEEDEDYMISLIDISSGGSQNLQQVTDLGSSTTNPITITVGDGGANGITSFSSQGYGVRGESSESPGVYGTSTSGAGVYGFSGSEGVIGEGSTGVKGIGYYGVDGNSYDGVGVLAQTNIGIGVSAVSESDGTGIYAYSTSGKGIEVYGNGTISIDVNLGNSNKGVVINSGTSSTGNTIEVNKNGVNKLTVNQAGELTATKLIKQGGTGTNILLDNGNTVALSSIGGNTNLSTSQTASNFTINSDTGTDASVPLGNGTLAGATLNDYTTAEKNKLAAITGTNTGDQNLQQVTDLGDTTTNDITAASFIKDGGFDFQFLKADGSVDNNTYLTSADLPSTLDLYATTSPDPVIAGYTALVRNIADSRYNTTAVNVPTPTITGTLASPTFCGAVISDPSILLGNPGVFNFSVIGKIRRTGGSTSSGADFFFSIYKRDISGVETLIADSSPVVVPANGGIYTEYISIALWNNGIFLSTDRVVLKFYGIKSGTGSGATYEFLFGGADPVRGTAAISSAIIPNLYLRDLADVEKVPALNNEVLYWNDSASLWEHSLVVDLTPNATATQKGLVSTGTQTFAGIKNFTSSPTAPTPTIGTNNTTVATTEFVNASIPGSTAYNILIGSGTGMANITTETTGTSGGLSYTQNGRNVMINNGATAITVAATVSSTPTDFIASYTKIGSATITFTFTGTGFVFITPNGAVLSGSQGSTALLTKNGSTVYLLINNIL